MKGKKRFQGGPSAKQASSSFCRSSGVSGTVALFLRPWCQPFSLVGVLYFRFVFVFIWDFYTTCWEQVGLLYLRLRNRSTLLLLVGHLGGLDFKVGC